MILIYIIIKLYIDNFNSWVIKKYTINIYNELTDNLIILFEISTNNIIFDYSTIYYNNINNCCDCNNYKPTINNIYNNIININNINIEQNDKITYNSLNNYSNVLYNTNLTSFINLTGKFYNIYFNQISNLLNDNKKILFSLYTNSILVQSISIDILSNLSLYGNFDNILNDNYSASINLIKNNIYSNLNNSYNPKSIEKYFNNYSVIICNNILNIINLFYDKTYNNYYYKLYYKPTTSNSNIQLSNKLDNINNSNNYYIKIVNSVFNELENIQFLVRFYSKYLEEIIINSLYYEKELNRLIYLLCSNYAIKISSITNISIYNLILKKNTLYDIVKVFTNDNNNKIYLSNTALYQNQEVFQLLNIALAQNYWFNRILIIIDTNINSINSYYNNFINFSNYLKKNNDELINNFKLQSNISVVDYFIDILNYDELTSLIFKIICIYDSFSPLYIYNNIIELANKKEVSSYLTINTDLIKKKIIIFLFVNYIIYSNISILLIEEFEKLINNTNLYLEYTFDNIVSFSLKDVFKSELICNDNVDLIKYAISTIYKLDNQYTLYNIPDIYKNNSEINFIIERTKIICSNNRYLYLLTFKYINSYYNIIGSNSINTTSYISNTSNSTISNLLNKINVIFNNDTALNNSLSYNLTIYSLNLLNIQISSEIYNYNQIINNKYYSNSSFINNKKYSYNKTEISDFNIVFNQLCLLLKNYNIEYENYNLDFNIVLGNLRLGNNPIYTFFEIFKGYTSILNISLNISPNQAYNAVKIVSRIYNIEYLTFIVNKFNNLSLITPSDFDNDPTFYDFGKNYKNFFIKYYSYDYNYYNFENNYIVIYKKLYSYYQIIINNSKAITNIKNYNIQLYLILFNDIVNTLIANVFYLDLNHNSNNYIKTFNDIINLYFKYNYSFRINYNIPNLENLNIQNIYNSIVNFQNINSMITYLINYYYYELFSNINNITTTNFTIDLNNFFDILQINSNTNYNYNYNFYNLIKKFEIILILITWIINTNLNLSIDNSLNIITFSNKLINYYTNIENINDFINFNYISNSNNIYNIIENSLNINEILDKLSKSINDIIYYVNNLSYDDNLTLVWKKYFESYSIRYYNIINNDYKISDYNIKKEELFDILYNYLNYQTLNSSKIYIFLNKDINDYFINLFSYIKNKKSYNVDINTISNIIFNNTMNNNDNTMNNNNDINTFIIKIFEMILNQNWGIIYFNNVINKQNYILDNGLLFLNYYFSYMNYLVITSSNFVKYNYDFSKNFDIFQKLNILYKIIIKFITINNFPNTVDVLFYTLINSNSYIYYGKKINTLDIENNIALYFDFLNSNIITDNKISNYYKDIQNNTIKISIKYNIINFVENNYNYNGYLINIFNNIVNNNILSLEDENSISYLMFYNTIINTYNNYNNNLYLDVSDYNVLTQIYENILYIINKNLSVFKEILGGENADCICIDNLNAAEIFKSKNYKNEKQIITIFSLIYKNINSNLIDNNSYIILFYYNCFITWITNDNSSINYSLDKLIYYFVNLINNNILRLITHFDNFSNISPDINLFFEYLNPLLFNFYTNYDYIKACNNYFKHLLQNYNNVLQKNILDNIINIDNKTSNKNIYSQFSSNNTNNDLKIINNKYNSLKMNESFITGINKTDIWKNLLGVVVDFNNSYIMKALKSIDNYLYQMDIQSEYINFIEKLTGGLINTYGIIQFIDSVQLQFDDELIDTYNNSMYKIFINIFQNLNNYKTIVNMLGLSESNNIIPGIKPWIKKFNSKLFILPLRFFFQRDENAIPMIACMYTNIQIKLFLNNNSIFNKTYNINYLTNLTINTALNSDFILVERDERIKICLKGIDNLIEKFENYVLINKIPLQYQPNLTTSLLTTRYDFNLQYMVKELIWNFELTINNYTIIIEPDISKTNKNNFECNYSYKNLNYNKIYNPDFIINTLILIDGVRRDGIQNLDVSNPNYNSMAKVLNLYNNNTKIDLNKNYYAYSFGLEPEEFQPTGAINMSKLSIFSIELYIDKQKLINFLKSLNIIFKLEDIYLKINLNTIEYNHIRYQSGLAGLLFIN